VQIPDHVSHRGQSKSFMEDALSQGKA
jgi:hypothetical protein